jgi:hypothetical protein
VKNSMHRKSVETIKTLLWPYKSSFIKP